MKDQYNALNQAIQWIEKPKEPNTMQSQPEFNMEASDEAREKIAERIKLGFTSGRIDIGNEKTYWEIKFNNWED